MVGGAWFRCEHAGNDHPAHAVERMLSLTTAQRDLLQLLLTTDSPLGAAALGQRLHLTPRQVHYGLREIRAWLGRRHATLRHAAGIGVQIICPPEQRQRLLAELASQSRFQLILTPEQRQQLLALSLLATREPLTLNQFQQDLVVARTTVLKDLDAVEPWLQTFDLQVARRQHRGCWVEGNELAKRQALAALLWGDVPFDRPIMAVQPGTGISFVHAQDAALLPIVDRANTLVRAWDLAAAQRHIVWAEAELGARFTDEAVVPLALAVALQLQRVRARLWVSWDPATLRWIQAQAVWPMAARIAAQLWTDLPEAARIAETAAFALQLLCGARDEPWRNNGGDDRASHRLFDTLLDHTAAAYAVPELMQDQLLRDGLEALILPACARQRFSLWAPPRAATDTHTERYAVERTVAAQLAADVVAATGMALPPDALDDLILLLRAAVVRARPERARHVLVVCPSGMATTQLLLARLKARFPRLGIFEVLPMRELTVERIAGADLIITTVPLRLPDIVPIDVIHVHPMLRPEDIAALTQWMV
jgi:mannitol operon transcriptional antiterminator